ncbi:MAG: ribose transport system ATP-binding protein [Solirubrobacteraceae bacterium]
MMTPGNVLEIHGLTKRFGNHAALDAVSFAVREREVVALLGDNGAGKSTLVKCIAGIYRPDDGEITLAGERFHAGSPAGVRAHGVGIVYQDLALFDNLSVAENLFAGSEPSWPARPRGLGVVRRRAMLDEARRTLHRLEVRIPNLKTPVGLLSGGQRQAIAVSKGIAFARQLVILDEPTAALGLRERGNVLRLIRQLPAAGVAVIVISHNLEDVISVADRAVVLRQGTKVGEVEATQDNHETMVSMIVGGPEAPASGM